MVIIGHRSPKSTLGANKLLQRYEKFRTFKFYILMIIHRLSIAGGFSHTNFLTEFCDFISCITLPYFRTEFENDIYEKIDMQNGRDTKSKNPINFSQKSFISNSVSPI